MFNLCHEYPLLFSPSDLYGVSIADVGDIAAMKIAAIADRGIKRDFIDLYFILVHAKRATLHEALALYDKKFKKLAQNRMHILKALIYFDDAEESEMPRMIKPVSWLGVKRFFIAEQRKIMREIIN